MTLADLKALLKLLRAQGVTEITWAGTHIKMGEKPEKKSKETFEEMEREPTIEELQFYSAGGG